MFYLKDIINKRYIVISKKQKQVFSLRCTVNQLAIGAPLDLVGCYAAALKKLREAKQTIDGRSQSEMARRAQFTWGTLLKIASHTWRSLATLRFRSFIGEGVGDWT